MNISSREKTASMIDYPQKGLPSHMWDKKEDGSYVLKEKAKQRITHLEEKQVLPIEILQLYNDNFDRIGELGIGTNPNAQLPSKYLIEAEKVDRTIHLALGSGYESDRATVYHWDAVAGHKQKLTVTALTSDGKEIRILIEGEWSKEFEEEIK